MFKNAIFINLYWTHLLLISGLLFNYQLWKSFGL